MSSRETITLLKVHRVMREASLSSVKSWGYQLQRAYIRIGEDRVDLVSRYGLRAVTRITSSTDEGNSR